MTTDTLQPVPLIGENSFNHQKSEAFADGLLDMLNSGALAGMLSIGHRTGLLDTMATLAPATSQQIADAAGLNERYVREWLGAMVTGHIVDYYSASQTYSLPAEHAAWLTRSASPNNIAVTMQFIPLIGSVEDAIVDCFYHGGGVPYSAYHRFHEVMAEDSGQTVVAALETQILPLVFGLKEQLTLGISVVDIGCGRGLVLQTLAGWFPNSQFIGYDLSADAIAWAKAEAQRLGLKNVTFQVQDAALIFEENQYDLILSFDAIHDQAQPDVVLQNIYRALRPDGLYLMQEIQASSKLEENLNHLVGPLLYSISCNHCTAVSLAAGGPGLGAMWGEELALEMLQAAGFSRVAVERLEHDFQNSYYLVYK
ncbi:class I SAM-dependent methyltransferase [Leptolyngbya cf. ectocarpi LEGE 11479]|uniref:Class I SAM-dependent methyltransferase n=1 Tax=Leptolyngbya cf. ectocarpi LEGE 11479 TaxID=1828722 RepID=A0A928X267_LEPEC|nr:class I SAM-dependent methyltransferase [Leptolyngbya ectocarpi]MBE9066199.1 class I SAM-dependent methyltransferase [Leptolyngbya cf. ectocarpi LEGE 11479]